MIKPLPARVLLVALVYTSISCQNRREEYLAHFETVWQTVHAQHFDTSFGGLDWHEAYDRYQPLIAAAEDDSAFYSIINRMLHELELSNLRVVPPGDWPLVEPMIFAEGSIGIDVRWLGDTAVVTSVKPGSPADQAGLRPSFVIRQMDGIPIEQIAGERLTQLEPPYSRSHSVTTEILGRLYGRADTPVSVTYADEKGATHEKSIIRVRRDREVVFTEVLPPTFVEFKSERLAGGIGYLWFNSFHPALLQEILSTIESMRDAPGLIVDLRGNSGGAFGVRKAVAEKLVSVRTLFWMYRARNRTTGVFLDPAESTYHGPVVVLIDVMSTSSSEEFAASLQSIGRALIVGERSPGSCLVAETMRLPNGATFVYPVAQTTTPNGTVIERNGVVPNVEVGLDRGALLEGTDSQLEAALSYLRTRRRR